MDFFEVLIVLAFILIPLLDGVFRQRRAGNGEGGKPVPAPRQQQERERAEARERVGAGAGAGAPTDESASDMIPADLWEILTGERRTGPAAPPAPWETPEEAPGEILEEEAAYRTEAESAEDAWISAPWESPEREPEPEMAPEPVSLEYVGPEAISLETPPPPPEVRHLRFHQKYDEPAFALREPVPSVASELRQGLEGAGLRRSILLAEILGPPKGLA